MPHHFFISSDGPEETTTDNRLIGDETSYISLISSDGPEEGATSVRAAGEETMTSTHVVVSIPSDDHEASSHRSATTRKRSATAITTPVIDLSDSEPNSRGTQNVQQPVANAASIPRPRKRAQLEGDDRDAVTDKPAHIAPVFLQAAKVKASTVPFLPTFANTSPVGCAIPSSTGVVDTIKSEVKHNTLPGRAVPSPTSGIVTIKPETKKENLPGRAISPPSTAIATIKPEIKEETLPGRAIPPPTSGIVTIKPEIKKETLPDRAISPPSTAFATTKPEIKEESLPRRAIPSPTSAIATVKSETKDSVLPAIAATTSERRVADAITADPTADSKGNVTTVSRGVSRNVPSQNSIHSRKHRNERTLQAVRATVNITTWAQPSHHNQQSNRPSDNLDRDRSRIAQKSPHLHLTGRQLYDAIHPLRPYQQAQAMPSWFDDFDVALLYVLYESRIQPSHQGGVPICTRMEKLGYAKHSRATTACFINGKKSVDKRLEESLQALRRLRVVGPVINVVASPARAADSRSRVITLPGPEGHQILVCGDWWIVDASNSRAVPIRTKQAKMDVCLGASIDVFYDEYLRGHLADWLWSTLRLLDPQLCPWSADRSILEANPHILLNPDHPLRHCLPRFWAEDFDSDHLTKPFLADGHNHYIEVWCHDHARVESMSMNLPWLFQLACGISPFSGALPLPAAVPGAVVSELALKYDQWVESCTRVVRRGDENKHKLFHGSHLCGNACTNPFHVILEKGIYNHLRDLCHFGARAKNELTIVDDFATCGCRPGRMTGHTCLLHDRRVIPESVNTLTLDCINRNIAALNACPLCRVVLASETTLTGVRDGGLREKITDHFILNHGYSKGSRFILAV